MEVRSALLQGEDLRKQVLSEFQEIRDKSELRFNYIAANQDRFIYYLNEDEKQQQKNQKLKAQIRQVHTQHQARH